MLRFLTNNLWTAVFLLSQLTVGRGLAGSTCKTRRCLADMLLKRKSLSQPQGEDCIHLINVPFMVYQTLSVDTKMLHLNTRLRASLVWMDAGLAWNNSVYQYDTVVLPVDQIWTPELHVTNGIKTSMEHGSRDLLAYSNGTLKHTVTITAEVNCEVNLFNFPFAADACPVAIQAWNTDGCGTVLKLGALHMIDGSHGDWQTESVSYEKKRDDRHYILVALRIKYLNPFVTLMLPSILILLADVISFALPLQGGERNCFKVTLVLSFTMFLVILNDKLPGDSYCNPVIRTHFCFCLSLLVLSMLVSMVLTGLANDGKFVFCWCTKGSKRQEMIRDKEEQEDEEVKPDISVIQLNASDESSRMIRKVLSFLEDLDAQRREGGNHHKLARTYDRIFFWLYLVFGTSYFCGMLYVMVKHECVPDHFGFWD